MTETESFKSCPIERRGDRLIALCDKALYAVIGAYDRFNSDGELETLFVWRSSQMENFAGIPSLFSERFDDPLSQLPDPNNLDQAQTIFDTLSRRRLGGAAIKAIRYLDSNHMPEDSSANKTASRSHTVLDIYQIHFPEGLDSTKLNPEFYSDVQWFTQSNYNKALGRSACGMCVATYYDAMSLLFPKVAPYTAADVDKSPGN